MIGWKVYFGRKLNLVVPGAIGTIPPNLEHIGSMIKEN